MTGIELPAVTIARPGEASFAAATAVFNLAAPVRPAAAVTVNSPAASRPPNDRDTDEGLRMVMLTVPFVVAGGITI